MPLVIPFAKKLPKLLEQSKKNKNKKQKTTIK
jgi:hypothetical protein